MAAPSITELVFTGITGMFIIHVICKCLSLNSLEYRPRNMVFDSYKYGDQWFTYPEVVD